MEFKIRAIKTEEQYNNYLNQVNKLMDLDPDPDSPKGELLEILVILIEEYESRLGYELSFPNDPVYVIKNRMEELGLKQKNLIPVMGDKSTVSRILKGERNLTYEMIGPLSDILKIPPDLLIKGMNPRARSGLVFSQQVRGIKPLPSRPPKRNAKAD